MNNHQNLSFTRQTNVVRCLTQFVVAANLCDMSSAESSGSSAVGIGQTKTEPQGAFTYLELLVIVAVFSAVLLLAVLPSVAKSKTRSPAAGCLSNLRQLMTGWQMYADDNNGRLMLNAPIGAFVPKAWCTGASGWGAIPQNTNVSQLLSALMGKYVNSNVTVYRCPGDVIPSQNGYRLRSYSMNGQFGLQPGQVNYGSPFSTYNKEADIKHPSPANLFVFCDQHPGSMDDGYFQVSSVPYIPEIPASYLEGGCGLSFVDGHAEIHKWQSVLPIPVRAGVTVSPITPSNTDPDWKWLSARAGSTNSL
jgi:hypothetical protein